MSTVSVVIGSASNVEMNPINHVIVLKPKNGERRIPMKVRILPGSLPIPKLAQNAKSRLRKTKDVII